jgi:hypothetical protein
VIRLGVTVQQNVLYKNIYYVQVNSKIKCYCGEIVIKTGCYSATKCTVQKYLLYPHMYKNLFT